MINIIQDNLFKDSGSPPGGTQEARKGEAYVFGSPPIFEGVTGHSSAF